MAERRMFAVSIVQSDKFLSLTPLAQLLYFHISVTAKDKGIVINARATAGTIGATQSDIDLLVEQGFLTEILFNDFPAYQITHWYENNGIGETAKKRNNYTYRQWRKAVIERDGECQMCGAVENLHAHHIKPFARYPKLQFDIDNGLTLCQTCHFKLHKEMRDADG